LLLIKMLKCSMTEGGLAKTTKAIQEGDELLEVDGKSVKGLQLVDAVPLLQNAGNVVRLKLMRVVTIPERDFHSAQAKSFRLPPARSTNAPAAALGHPAPASQPIYAAVSQRQQPLYSPLGSPLSNYRLCSKVSFKGEADLPTVTLLPRYSATPKQRKYLLTLLVYCKTLILLLVRGVWNILAFLH
jgi:PDZ domain